MARLRHVTRSARPDASGRAPDENHGTRRGEDRTSEHGPRRAGTCPAGDDIETKGTAQEHGPPQHEHVRQVAGPGDGGRGRRPRPVVARGRAGVVGAPVRPRADSATVEHFGPAAPVVYVGLLVAQAVLAPLPAPAVAAAGGYAFGTFAGFVLTWLGVLLGGALCFWISRLFGREYVARSERLKRLDRRIEEHGAIIVFAVRLVPLISFDAISYAAGLTGLSFWRFFLASALGSAPGTFVFVYLGGTSRERVSTRRSVSLQSWPWPPTRTTGGSTENGAGGDLPSSSTWVGLAREPAAFLPPCHGRLVRPHENICRIVCVSEKRRGRVWSFGRQERGRCDGGGAAEGA
jgi:uncharacterized membrane protein YdjX (TVP38/TMEM64 family)